MIFKYRRVNLQSPFSNKQHLLRPIIPLSLVNGSLAVRYEALIDSGADFCIFPEEIAKKLKLNLTSAKEIYFSSATGEMVQGVIINVILNIAGEKVKTKVVFANLADKVGLLGQYGFFDLFIVKFDLKKEEIELKPRS